jgi:cytochrome c biogenesis protein CcdA
MKGSKILFLSGALMLLIVFIIGIYIVPRAQSGGPKTARQSDAARVPISDVYLDITYATPDFVKRVKLEPYLGAHEKRAQPFLIGINTHVGSIEQLDLRGKVHLQDSDGNLYPAIGEPVVVSEHHNMYLLAFPLLDHHGKPIFAAERGAFRLVVSDVGKTPQRTFEWKLPVVEETPARTLANALVMALSVIGALMVILSPCAIELTTYYTGIIAGVVSSAAIAEKGAKMPFGIRARIVRNLAAFVAGFTLLYTISGAMVSSMGQKLITLAKPVAEEICSVDGNGTTVATATKAATSHAGHAAHGSMFGPWAHYANWLGAAFLVFFALKAIGAINRGNVCFVWMAQLGRKIRVGIAWVVGLVSPKRAAVIRAPGFSMRVACNITPANSFCAGLGLSVSCLTCMGGAILYPLLIFVGTSTWYWGALILGTYSLALAVPMAAIALAVGNFAWQWSTKAWVTRGLQYTSAVVMISVAVLIAFDRTRFINTVVFTMLSAVGGKPDASFAQL